MTPHQARSTKLAAAKTTDIPRHGDRPTRIGTPFLERLLEQAFDAAVVLDADLHIVYANDAARRVWGYDPESLSGDSGWDFIHPDDHDKVARAVGDLLAQPGHHITIHARGRRADGEWRWAEGTAMALRDPDVQGIVVNIRDVTDKVLADQALKASAAHLAALLANIDDIVSVHDPDGRIRYVSPSVARVIGEQQAAALKGTHPLKFVVEADRDRVHGVTRSWLAGSNERVEFDVHGFDGEIHTVESSAVDLLDDPHVNGIVVTTRDITARRKAEEDLRRLALFDTLTGLPNRQLLLDRIERGLVRQREEGCTLAVLFLDLDEFQTVNEVAGHAAGDELLIEVGRRLRRIVKPRDTVGRWGGDEFVVALEDAEDAEAVHAVADRIHTALTEPFSLAGAGEVYVGASVGIAIGPAEDAHALLSAADGAMHQAKEAGRSRSELFDETRRQAAVERLRLHAELPRALERDQLELHYQPIIDLATGRPVGVEALIRWAHPERGRLAPAAFLPAAERSHLINDIGAWVLRAACTDAASRAAAGSPLHVAVNLSARQLADPALAAQIEGVLSDTGLDPTKLTLEVTESAVMADPETATAILGRVRQRGVRVAVDDFGTGYSSLGYLRRLPCDTVKIDRSFVAGLGGKDDEDTVIVSAVVALAHALDLVVVAEGCERQEQAGELAALGADYAQGYLWARPVPFAELPALLESLDRG